MPYYESVFIARQDISAQQVEQMTETLTGVVGEQGGSVARNEYWGLRNLAYRIKKNRKGHYVMLNLDAPAPAIDELERQYRLNEDIIRFMTIKVDALTDEASVMTQTKAAREANRARAPRDEDNSGDAKKEG